MESIAGVDIRTSGTTATVSMPQSAGRPELELGLMLIDGIVVVAGLPLSGSLSVRFHGTTSWYLEAAGEDNPPFVRGSCVTTNGLANWRQSNFGPGNLPDICRALAQLVVNPYRIPEDEGVQFVQAADLSECYKLRPAQDYYGGRVIIVEGLPDNAHLREMFNELAGGLFVLELIPSGYPGYGAHAISIGIDRDARCWACTDGPSMDQAASWLIGALIELASLG